MFATKAQLQIGGCSEIGNGVWKVFLGNFYENEMRTKEKTVRLGTDIFDLAQNNSRGIDSGFRAILISILLFLLTNPLWAGKIIYPWRATTAIVTAGENFEIWFAADDGQTASSVKLQGPFNTIATKVDVITGEWVYDQMSGNSYNTRIKVTVPTGTPADRYSIILNTSTQQERSSGAVKVIAKPETNYYVLHFSDTHTFKNSDESKWSLNKVSTFVDIANIIDPAMVIITGDNISNINDEKVNKYFNGVEDEGVKGLSDIHAATFMAAGNHDAPGANHRGKSPMELAKFWNTHFGLQDYHFSYGEARFMVINDSWSVDHNHQVDAHLAWLEKKGMGNLRVGACHKVLEEELIKSWQSEADIDYILGGHNHHKGHINPHPVNNKLVAYIAPSREYFMFNLYKVDGIKGTMTPLGLINSDVLTPGFGRATGLLDATKNPKKRPSKWRSKLTLKYKEDNNGLASENTAILVNKFDFEIDAARVRFVMPRGTAYNVSKGTVTQAFDGDTVHVVDVRVDLKANSTTKVQIIPIGQR